MDILGEMPRVDLDDPLTTKLYFLVAQAFKGLLCYSNGLDHWSHGPAEKMINIVGVDPTPSNEDPPVELDIESLAADQ
jgi:hypothetical protein